MQNFVRTGALVVEIFALETRSPALSLLGRAHLVKKNFFFLGLCLIAEGPRGPAGSPRTSRDWWQCPTISGGYQRWLPLAGGGDQVTRKVTTRVAGPRATGYYRLCINGLVVTAVTHLGRVTTEPRLRYQRPLGGLLIPDWLPRGDRADTLAGLYQSGAHHCSPLPASLPAEKCP